jgi:YfiH family protein
MIRITLGAAEVAFSGRTGGVSPAPFDSLNVGRLTDDDPKLIEANISALRASLGLDQLQLLEQVHGNDLQVVVEPLETMPRADAATTTSAGIGLLATGADCPPIALASNDRVAIVHGGWRPVAAGLIEKAAAMFGDADLDAVIGPGICQAHFEVGPEVVDALGGTAADRSGGRQLDLRGVIADRLVAAGADSVDDVDRCTACEPENFFSHRRDNGQTGRQAGIVWLR